MRILRRQCRKNNVGGGRDYCAVCRSAPESDPKTKLSGFTGTSKDGPFAELPYAGSIARPNLNPSCFRLGFPLA